MTIANAGKHMEKLEHLYTLLRRMQRGTDALETSVAVPYRTKHPINGQPSDFSLGHISQRNKNLCSDTNLYTMFIEVYELLIIVKHCKHPRHYEMTEGLNKKKTVVHPYDSTIERNKVSMN